MSKTEITKRYILFIWGLFFAAIGVAFTKHGELGVSPVSSVANVFFVSGTNGCSILIELSVLNPEMGLMPILILRKEVGRGV